MNRQTRLDHIAEEVKTIPRRPKSGRPVDLRYFDAYIRHCILAGNPEPPGALHFALMHLPEDEGPLNPALERIVQATLEGAEPGDRRKVEKKLNGTQRRALERWYGCLLKGWTVPKLLAQQLGLKPGVAGEKVESAG